MTLLGDATHLMPPAGEGTNLAMFGGAELGKAIAAHLDDIEAALTAYEEALFPRSESAATDAHLIMGSASTTAHPSDSSTSSTAPLIRSSKVSISNGVIREDQIRTPPDRFRPIKQNDVHFSAFPFLCNNDGLVPFRRHFLKKEFIWRKK